MPKRPLYMKTFLVDVKIYEYDVNVASIIFDALKQTGVDADITLIKVEEGRRNEY
jgi:hypothetical protein